MDSTSASSRTRTQQLPISLQLHVLSLLPPNDRALRCRFVCREAADTLSEPQPCTASLSQPLPPYAAPWAIDAGQQHVRQLPFLQKFQLLCAAATSGSEVNLEVAWALLKPSIFPEQLQDRDSFWARQMDFADPGVAAVEMGHPQLLSWLQSCCSALLRPGSILKAAAQHCDLAGLQLAWQTLAEEPTRCRDSGSLHQVLLDAAAGSTAPDAVAKMDWALAVGAGACHPTGSTAVSAALSGDHARLQWLQEHGYQLPADAQGRAALVPCCAMEQGSRAAVQWLVDEAGFRLPGRVTEAEAWERLLQSAARSADGVAKLRWLQELGAPPLAADVLRRNSVVVAATEARQMDVLRYLLSVFGPVMLGWQGLAATAAGSGSIAIATLLRQAGLEFGSDAYRGAARAGSMDMLRWLATEVGVPRYSLSLEDVILAWPCKTRRDSYCLLDAVRQLLDLGWRCVHPSMLMPLAASRGDLALVQYLYERRPWQQHPAQVQAFEQWKDGEAIVSAAHGGCEALLEWLAGNGSSYLSGRDRASPWIVAGKHGDRGTLVALRRLGVQWGSGDVVVQAVRHWCCMPAVRWLAGQGAPVGSRWAMMMVVRSQMQKTCEDAVWLLGLAGPAEPDAGDEDIDLM